MSRSTMKRSTVLCVLGACIALIAVACGNGNAPGTAYSRARDSAGPAPTGATTDYADLSGTLDGSGATFPKSFYEEAIAGFAEVASKVTVNYGGGGSGKGKTDLADKVVVWAGSDSVVRDEDLSKFNGGRILYFPTVAAPITVSFHVSGLDGLRLSPSTLAKIFQSQITRWDDSAVAADNPDVSLPSKGIVVVHRSDGSGTTSNFTRYLASAAGADWAIGAGDTVRWPADTQAGNGNAGVAQIIKDTDGAIGYVDLSDAKASGLKFASIRNRAGELVAPTLEGATAAMEAAEVKANLTFSALDTSGAQAYPITAGTYIIVYANQVDAEIGNALRAWIGFVLTEGQTIAPEVDFAPLPDSIRTRAADQLGEITVG